MEKRQFISTLKEDMETKSLLKHPFYQMWNKGTLSKEALVEYAKQYYHFTEHFPRFVARVYSNCKDVEVRKVMIHNLIEEELGDFNNVRPHAEQWLGFCKALGIEREDAINAPLTKETEALLEAFDEVSSEEFTSGVAGLMSYEMQVSEIAKTKREGLVAHFGFSKGSGVEFFDTHEVADIHHTKVWTDIIENNSEGNAEQFRIRSNFNKMLDAQWKFLDGIMHTCNLAC